MPDTAKEGQDEIEVSKAPLMDHLIELRQRLIYALIGIGLRPPSSASPSPPRLTRSVAWPYQVARGPGQKIEMIYTAPHEFFFTKLKLALFGAVFLAFPFPRLPIGILKSSWRRASIATSATPSGPICCGLSCCSSRERWSSISSSCRWP